jgi:N-acetyl-anhydromuramyl-L-alanine amidase AmpD
MIDLSTIRFIKSPNFRAGRNADRITHIVLHCPLGTLQGTIATFQNTIAQVSAHYVIDRDGSITQMVQLVDTAWHVCNANPFCIGIEMVDRYPIAGNLSDGCLRDKGWLTNPELTSVVQLVAALMQKFNIPLQNVIGHSDPYLRQFGNNHQDPGMFFPWMQFRSMVSDLLKPSISSPPPVRPLAVTGNLQQTVQDLAISAVKTIELSAVGDNLSPSPVKTRKPRGRKITGRSIKRG